ncbi:MAG: hypothetical protein JW969_16150 [Spirochaetales bacterium]|nr:hypothetical protein [Spirochaetales bacterium]
MKKIAFCVLIFLVIVNFVQAQSLLTQSEDYKKAQEYQRLSEEAFDMGDYDKAYEYAELAKEHSRKALEYAEAMSIKYRSNGLIQAVEDKLTAAKRSGADKDFADEYNSAVEDYNSAKSNYDDGDYQTSIDYSNSALQKLNDLEEKITMRGSNFHPTEDGMLPKYYKVRKIVGNRDCFWNIAAYPFVYNDAKKWKILYQANKSKLKNPNNPSLINPGQVFIIPSIEGEEREGTYIPDDEE